MTVNQVTETPIVTAEAMVRTRRKRVDALFWAAVAVLSIFGGAHLPADAIPLQSDFVVSYLGVVLGLIVAIITFLHGVADRLLEKLVEDRKRLQESHPERAGGIQEIVHDIEGLFRGLMKVIRTLFFFFVLVMSVCFAEAFDLPDFLVMWPLPISFTVSQVFSSLKVASVLFSLAAAMRVITNLFKVISASVEARSGSVE